jgi:hypothetical protein
MKFGLHIKERNRMREPENRVLMGVFEPLKEDVMGGWRKTV